MVKLNVDLMIQEDGGLFGAAKEELEESPGTQIMESKKGTPILNPSTPVACLNSAYDDQRGPPALNRSK